MTVILSSPPYMNILKKEDVDNPVGILHRSIDILTNEASSEDVRRSLLMDKYQKSRIEIYRPKTAPLPNPTSASGDEIKKAVDAGYLEVVEPWKVQES